MSYRRPARLAAVILPLGFATSLGAAEPPVPVNPTLGPPIEALGPRNIPNLALKFSPKTRAAEREATHEGPEYWKARGEWQATQNFELPPPDMLRALVEKVYRRRLEARQRYREGQESSLETQAVAEWRSLGPTKDAGRVRDYAFTADGSKLYVATANGGIWRLTRQGGPGGDYGNPENLTDDLPLLTFGAVAIAPSNPNVVYVATGEQARSANRVNGYGTLRSTDAGATWQFNTQSVTGGFSSLVPGKYSYDLNVSPLDANDVLLAAGEGIFRTRNGGQTWERKVASQQTNDKRTPINFQRRPDNPNVVWAGLWGGLAVSVDGGETWIVDFENIATQVSYPGTAARSIVAMSPSNPNRIYWLVAGQTNDGGYSQVGVFRSDNGGQNWNIALGPPSGAGYPLITGTQGWSFLAMAVDPTNPNRIIAGGLDTWRSEDGGLHWTQISDWHDVERTPHFCHADIDEIAFEPGLPNYWVGSDGGLFRSVDGGRTYVWKNEGVVARMFSSLAQHPTDPYRLYAGTQDNGTNRLSGNSPAAWKRVFYGDGYDCLVNYQSPNIVYATNFNNYTSRADDGGEAESSFHLTNCPDDWQTVNDCSLKPVTTFRSRLAMDPVDPKIIYAMTDRFYYTTNGASDYTDWKSVYNGYFCSDGFSNTACTSGYAGCTAISVNPKDRRQVAFGTGVQGGTLYYTLNNFGNTPAIAIGSQVNAIVWDPLNANAVYVGLESSAKLGSATSGHTAYWIYHLDTTPAFFPLDNGLELPIIYAGGSITYFVPVDSMAVSPLDGNLLFAGTKYGIFKTTDGGLNWSPFGTDFPATWVSALLFTPDGSKIRAATWGRGLWEANPNGGAITTTQPTPAFTFSPASPRPGQVVSFSDQTSGGPSSWAWSFGDGGTSTQQNPTHVFANPGSFSVTLTATNSAGSRSTSQTVVVTYGTTGTGSVYTYLLPVVLTTSGAGGAFFTTELTLTNRSGRTLNLTFRTKGTFDASSTYSLPAGQQVFADVFSFLHDQTGMPILDGTKLVSLRIEVASADNLSQFSAQVRVTTPPTDSLRAQGVGGRFGLAFPALPLGRGANSEAYVYGLQQTSDPPQPGTRSNVACVHAGGGSLGNVTLEITYHDGNTGLDHASKDTLNLAAFQWQQQNQPLGARGIQHGFARVRRTSGNDQFVCYGVLNDNVTGDGAFIPMVPNDVPSATPFALVPVILDTGAFTAELTIANRTSRQLSGLFAVFPYSDPVPQWGYVNLDPGTQLTFSNFVAALRDVGFDLPTGTIAAGAIQFLEGTFDPQSDTQPTVPTSDAFVGARIYATRAGGTLGFGFTHTAFGKAADTEAYIYGLQQSGARGQEGGTRANLAVIHALGGQIANITLEVTYFGPNGQELGKEPLCNPCTLQPGEWRQFNAPLEKNGYGVPHGYARIRKLSGTDQFLAYGVLNDQANDDGSYVPMVVP